MDSEKLRGSIGEDVLEEQTTDAKPLQLPKIPDIPLDVMVDVISRLPLKVIVRYKCLSKDFKNIISVHALSRRFHTNSSNSCYSICVKRPKTQGLFLHLAEFDQSDFDNEKGNHEVNEVQIFDLHTQRYGTYFSAWGYCNGLFCLSRIEEHYHFRAPIVSMRIYERIHHLFVTNPILGEVIQLPNPCDTKNIFYLAYGIGHCQFTNRYKVVRIITEYIGHSDYKNNTQIFTIGSDQNWRSVMDVNVPYNIDRGSPTNFKSKDRYEQTPMLAFRSALHWVVEPVIMCRSTTMEPHWGGREYICAFDMTDEKVTALPLPPTDVETDVATDCFIGRLSVLSDKLCMPQPRFYGGDSHAYVWAMDDYGVEASWVKLFSLKMSTLPIEFETFTLVWLTVSPGVIVISDRSKLLFYDLEKKKCFRTVHLYNWDCDIIPFVPCFVPCL